MFSIVFDMDGVIFDTEALSKQTWMELAPEYEISDMESLYTRVVGVNRTGIYRILKEAEGEGFDAEGFVARAQAKKQKMEREKGIPVKKGAAELFAFLREKRAAVALASSSNYAVVEHNLRRTGFRDCFQVVVGGDMVERSKPEPDIYLYACERLGADPKRTYGVEDSHNGMRSIYRAGMKPIMVPDLLPVTTEMEQMAEVILPDLVAVKDYLQKHWDSSHLERSMRCFK